MWIASFTTEGVTHSDRVVIQVTDAAPLPLTTFSIHTTDGSSNSCSPFLLYDSDSCSPFTVTTTGQFVVRRGPCLWSFSPLETVILRRSINWGSLLPLQFNRRVELYAETWAYGVAKRDSLRFTINPTNIANVIGGQYTPYRSLQPYLQFSPPSVHLLLGGRVLFYDNATDIPFDVVIR